ncbi:olfactory receptor 6C74-like isoform X1 [Manis pentadactyla]|uniref:olfactory receptor 6C74-like isoform X1 n=1 Tax=Manis pentadactyla TaxID=143292 RepID=UPI00255C4702|nr:olfactory receptor 6C74-like isoform X1 [Manis pentadactyla]XP_057342737.1 olfactory receptor 6C74-like isoform X1 [Manis pentadactyla]XP_057342738.1 olfactory receptor 6C74-like isoform X1 [Manis pentadactyla]XP_057342739.1 olfactory receptor 6C74-like isoform X1 [Manis pentadactyla]XP_057342740.1 olfactory receptor 6C74-like isoform X1 [Manis pentadactyla]XP_057342741.1 olfactory receptor 6C74-like isoform X1 [Manis pentadactyla]
MENHTRVTVFILTGLTEDPQLEMVLFTFLLLTYLLSITGNLIIITLTLLDTHLKTPMYFFLRNFSFLEISYTTTCIPKLLVMMATGDKTISYNSCAAQVFFAFLLGASEFYLLAAMSYDRYVAICKPLHYTVIMSTKICTQLVFCCWLAGFFVILPPLLLGLNIDFCDSNTIDHFYCDTTPLLQISCSDTQLFETMGFVSAVMTLLVTLAMVIVSYTYIAITILKIPSANQRKKAFSTCSSHMIVISLSYGSCIFMYVKPSVKQRVSFSKGIAVLNTSVAPLLNPFIYTLRNQQVKKSFMNMIHRVVSLPNK